MWNFKSEDMEKPKICQGNIIDIFVRRTWLSLNRMNFSDLVNFYNDCVRDLGFERVFNVMNSKFSFIQQMLKLVLLLKAFNLVIKFSLKWLLKLKVKNRGESIL